jgi:hypothetical protein
MTNPNQVLTVKYGVKMFPITRQDRRLAQQLKYIMGVGRKVGTFKKNRLDPKAPEWLRICAARDGFRKYHYAVTVPYRHGEALLSPLALDDYIEVRDKFETEFYAAVDALIARAEDLKAEARQALTVTDDSGREHYFYSESDYADLTADAFSFDSSIEPIRHDASFEKFADMIGAEKAQELADAMAEDLRKTWEHSTKSVVVKVVAALKHASNRLHTAKRWNPSSIDALIELADLLPILNIANDPDVEQARREVSALFRHYNSQNLQDREARTSCAIEVDAILAKMPSI